MSKKKISFVVYGEPIAKGRPRVTKRGAYTPEKTVRYEELVKFSYLQTERVRFTDGEALMMHIDIFMSIPKSTSKKKAEMMHEGSIRPTKKPDIDNIIKAMGDSLNKLAFEDDSQVVCIVASKYYSYEPRVEITITEVIYEV